MRPGHIVLAFRRCIITAVALIAGGLAVAAVAAPKREYRPSFHPSRSSDNSPPTGRSFRYFGWRLVTSGTH